MLRICPINLKLNLLEHKTGSPDVSTFFREDLKKLSTVDWFGLQSTSLMTFWSVNMHFDWHVKKIKLKWLTWPVQLNIFIYFPTVKHLCLRDKLKNAHSSLEKKHCCFSAEPRPDTFKLESSTWVVQFLIHFPPLLSKLFTNKRKLVLFAVRKTKSSVLRRVFLLNGRQALMRYSLQWLLT